IPDSAIKIQDKEIADYISKHKEEFKQPESRSISYVTFNASPSKTDTATTKEQVAKLVDGFKNAPDVKAFLDREGSDLEYTGNFVRAADMQQANKDTLLKIPVGGVYGPYLDNTHFVTAKMIESRMAPDSVTVRHILVKTADQNPQTGALTQTRDTAEARKFINDSVIALINRGVPFDSVCRKYSDDGGSKDSGGVYKNIQWGKMVPGFNDFIFTNGPGSKGVAYTEFGFHYIEVLQHFGAADNRIVKFAFLARKIEPSPETDNNASNEANQFAGDSRDIKSFDDNYEKNLKPKGINKGIASVSRKDGQIMGVGFDRNFVRSIYEAKLGQVLKPEKIEDKYVVAVITEVLKEGTMSVAKARTAVEGALRNKKKAAILKQKVGTVTTLEAAASAWGGKQIETIDSVRISGGSNSLGYEPRVIGAVFNPANKGKVIPEALEGQSAVYVVRVDNISTTAVMAGSVAEQRKQMIDQRKNSNNPFEALKKMASIKDKRTDRY
ncbi:MAG TPA: peptidylprolyl isomerase, partial [Chitinophagaceae bacterium]|nr:peptidylprolyl isomerase [Chitinophagaceae bacterium]